MANDSFLAIHSVDRCSIAVPDLGEAERFYLAFGLEVRRVGDTLRVGAHGGGHPVLEIQRATRYRLLGLSLGIHAADLPRFAGHLDHCGIRFTSGDDSLRLHDGDGTAIELVVAAKTSPSAPSGLLPRAMAPRRAAVATVRPVCFSHLLLFAPDVRAAVDFYGRVLGLRLSDRSGDGIAFMHTPHGSDHHLIAFAKSTGPGLHHTSWQVRSLDEVGLGAMQLAARGYAEGWGVGRHVLGSNYFHYAKAPWGGYAEYSFDMDHIAAGSDWAAADHAAEDSFYVWGPPPPPDFAHNTDQGGQPNPTKETS